MRTTLCLVVLLYLVSAAPIDNDRTHIHEDNTFQNHRDAKIFGNIWRSLVQKITQTEDTGTNGGWSGWSSWSACSATCGPATKERERTCTEPAPANGGAQCQGYSQEVVDCDQPGCDEDSCQTSNGACKLPFTYRGNTYNGCTKDGWDRAWCQTQENESGQWWGVCSEQCKMHKDLGECSAAEETDCPWGYSFIPGGFSVMPPPASKLLPNSEQDVKTPCDCKRACNERIPDCLAFLINTCDNNQKPSCLLLNVATPDGPNEEYKHYGFCKRGEEVPTRMEKSLNGGLSPPKKPKVECGGGATMVNGVDALSSLVGSLPPNVSPVFNCPGPGRYRDPDDCAVSYYCSNGVATKQRCNDGLVFNLDGVCDRSKNVNCDVYPDYNKITKSQPSLAQAQAIEESLTSSEMMKKVKHDVETLDSSLVDKIYPGRLENPENVKRVESILTKDKFNDLFPDRNSVYTYLNFLQAIGKFPAICSTYSDRDSDLICKKTLATMFAHFTQETGGHDASSDTEEWRQGLVYVTELGCNETSPGCELNEQCNPGPGGWSDAYPCGKNPDGSWKKYFGRGAKQISYNYNYGRFSDAMFGTVHKLLDDPSLVATTWLSFASATWFFVYPRPPIPSMLSVIDGTWQPNEEDISYKLEAGFGATILIINGIECNHYNDNAINRMNYYRKFSEEFKIDIEGEQLSCAHMSEFPKGGSGALKIHWDQNWLQKYECMLVPYEMPYTAFLKGGYVRCVEDNFNVILS